MLTATAGRTTSRDSPRLPPAIHRSPIPGSSTTEGATMPSIHFRTTVDAPADDVYAALATQDGLAGNWTDQLEVPIDALEPGRRVEWTPVGGFPGWIGTSITWRLEPAGDGETVVHFAHGGWPDEAA